jgi:dTDP-4-dehydrorhamnose 3,5-epimerase
MVFTAARIPGVYIVEPDKLEDERGFFARTFCQREFEAHGLTTRVAQCSLSFNPRKATLRGMHYQVAPYAETKLVRCTQGAVYDVLADLRQDSPTFLQWLAVELTAKNRKLLCIPEGVAHGFQTLADDSELFYQISEFHHPECARGVRWNDPVLNIHWPLPPAIVSERDAGFPLLSSRVLGGQLLAPAPVPAEVSRCVS